MIQKAVSKRNANTLAEHTVLILIFFFACCSLTLNTFSNTPSSDAIKLLISQLGNKDERIRINAGRVLTDRGKEAVPALIEAFKDHNKFVNMHAMVIVGKIGPAALPELIRALEDKDEKVRASAAEAIGLSESKLVGAVPALIKSLQDQNKTVRIASIKTLGKIGPEAASSTSALRKILKSPDDEVREKVLGSLGEIGPEAKLAIPDLIDILLKDRNADIRSATASALGSIDRKDPSVIAALIAAFKDEDANVAGLAALAIGMSKNDAAVPALMEVLEDSNPNLRARSVEALGLIGVKAKEVVPALTQALKDSDDDVRAKASEALGAFGAEAESAVASLTEALEDRIPVVRANAASSLGAIGPRAIAALPVLIEKLNDRVEIVGEAIARALGRISPEAAPSLLGALADKNSFVPRQAIVFALTDIATTLQDDAKVMSDTDLGRSIAVLQQADQAIKEAAPEMADAIASVQRSQNDLVREQSARKAGHDRVRAYFFASAVGALLLGTFALLFSFQLRRRFLVLLGRRWNLVSGNCDGVVEVLYGSVLSRSLSAAQPVISGFALSGFPPKQSDVESARKVFGCGWSIRVVVERLMFKEPWAHLLGSEWSDGQDAVIAGQICVVPADAVAKVPSGQKNIAFAGLACSNSVGLPLLEAVDGEIETVAMCYRRWKADVRLYPTDATVKDLQEGLRTSDIIHVAAHASVSGIYLHDRLMSVLDLDETILQSLRCRLLVLSACDAGRLDEDDSFVYRLVESGVNVLAAVNVVRDQVCRTFFEEFYTALLPDRRSEGIEIGAAIRQAAQTCADRFEKTEALLFPDNPQRRWKKTLNSFILYGDPSSHLRLK